MTNYVRLDNLPDTPNHLLNILWDRNCEMTLVELTEAVNEDFSKHWKKNWFCSMFYNRAIQLHPLNIPPQISILSGNSKHPFPEKQYMSFWKRVQLQPVTDTGIRWGDFIKNGEKYYSAHIKLIERILAGIKIFSKITIDLRNEKSRWFWSI